MHRFIATCLVLIIVQPLSVKSDEGNPAIDYNGFLRQAAEVAKLRRERRVSVEEFVKLAKKRDAVILDARSREKFKLLHVKGAVNLPFPDFTEQDLNKVIPKKESIVLIYCNNNFRNDPVAMMTKAPTASLNIHTFNALHSYGYKNVYELKPFLNIGESGLEFGGTRAVTHQQKE